MRAAPSCARRLRRAADGARRGLIDTPGRTRASAATPVRREARGRSRGEIPGKVLAGLPWKAKNPGEHPAVDALNTPRPARDSARGSIPGNRARRMPAFRFVVGQIAAEKTVCGCTRLERAAVPLAEEKAPKGKSHERRRHETRPARPCGEKTGERVIKNPEAGTKRARQTRDQSRDRKGTALKGGPAGPHVLKGNKAHESGSHACPARAGLCGLGSAGQCPRRRQNSKRGVVGLFF